QEEESKERSWHDEQLRYLASGEKKIRQAQQWLSRAAGAAEAWAKLAKAAAATQEARAYLQKLAEVQGWLDEAALACEECYVPDNRYPGSPVAWAENLPGSRYDPEESALLCAVSRWRGCHQDRLPNQAEQLTIFFTLGYRKPGQQRLQASDQQDFRLALAAYQQEQGRRFPTWTEILQVVRQLGYRRVVFTIPGR